MRNPNWGAGLTALWLAACGADVAAPMSRGSANGATTDNSSLDLVGCKQANLTRACTCNGLAGRQVCDGASWKACECAMGGAATSVNLEGNNRSDIHFVWEKTAASADVGGCLPGDYEGTFGGIYWSYIATLAPIEKLAVPIANVDIPGEPSGFHFTVEPAQGGETVLQIKGVMNGTADLTFPFTAQLTGELDCKSKTFNARMSDGLYSVLIEGLVAQQFSGVMSGQYDVRTHTFVNGSWDVWETSGVPPGRQAPMLPREFDRDGFGGFGTWAAALPTNLTDPQLGACPQDFSCEAGQLGPNKHLCSSLLGAPGCTSQADCDANFPGEHVNCLQTSAFSTCLKECKP
jgi:hypothetical protein